MKRRLLRCERGATAVEFGFIAPAMLVLIFGVVEVGWAIFEMSSLNKALSETVRWAYTAVEADATAGMEAEVRAQLVARSATVPVTAGEVSVAFENAGNCSAAEIVVTVRHSYGAMLPGLLPFGDITFDQTLSGPLQCFE